MSERHPLLVDLGGRRVVVIGGGPTATRKVESLLPGGPAIEVIAPELSERLAELERTGRIVVHHRQWVQSDLDKAWLVVAATGNQDSDGQVAVTCERRPVWCVCTSSAGLGTAALPATASGENGVRIAASGGGNPRLAKEIANSVELLLRLSALPLRRDGTTQARSTDRPSGRAILVGAGPGDPELITLRGLRALAEAEVLIVDRLAPRALWEAASPSVEIIQVGKTAGTHPVPQDQINELIVERALAGKTVVRLKGGDPFMMGRGAEEALACVTAGVPVEVVPGVTSALAVPAASGIPVTCRGVASSFLVAAAHEGTTPLDEIARSTNAETTLVLIMGARKLHDIAQILVDCGRSPTTPIAVIESGWTPEMSTWRGSLADVLRSDRQPQAPAIVVIGDVVALHDSLGQLAAPSPLAGHGPRRDTR